MMDSENNLEMSGDQAGLLRQLMHLKRYEVPEVPRMTRNKQNIMRKVRHTHARERKSLMDVMEANVPWFFAEPKYGIIVLVMAFIGLQYVDINARNSAQSSTGIYASTEGISGYQSNASTATNSVLYPSVPNDYRLFDRQKPSDDLMFVEHLRQR